MRVYAYYSEVYISLSVGDTGSQRSSGVLHYFSLLIVLM